MGDGAVGEPGSPPLGRLLAGIDALLWVGSRLEDAVVVAGEGAERELSAGAMAAAQGGWAQAFGAGWARAGGALSITIIAPATRELIRIAG